MNLTRSKSDRWVFGVCGGIGRQTGISPNLVRLGVVAIVILVPMVGPVAAGIVYLVMGLLLPESEEY